MIRNYLEEVKTAMGKLDLECLSEIVELLQWARLKGKRIYVFGNGGSATTASHIAGDLVKNTRREDKPPVKAVSLTDNVYQMTAIANDLNYEFIFWYQLRDVLEMGDVVIAVTGSGKSRNVIFALAEARERGATTMALTGFDGGDVINRVDHCLIVPSKVMEQIEDIHLMIGHILAVSLREYGKDQKTENLLS